jgi:uncharacterized Ntn-hydrolase superfamily protein
VTYSIVARDPATGELGVAVQTHAQAVGSLCPVAEAGVGAVATQSIVDPAYGPRGLDALRAGESPADALVRLTAADEGAALRQVAIVDAAGRVATHTGARCIALAGHVTGDGFSCQANMMREPGVPEAMAAAFVAAHGPLPVRMLAALDAGQAAGGDIRGMQSAAMVVVAAGPAPPMHGRMIDRRVDDHPEPLVELRRLVELCTDDPAMLAALGRGNPEGWFWHGITLASEGDLAGARAALAHAYAVSEDWRELVRRLPASGLLDASLVDALTAPAARG